MPPPFPGDFVAAFDQAQAEALRALGRSEAFVLFVAVWHEDELGELKAYVAAPAEMLDACERMLEDR